MEVKQRVIYTKTSELKLHDKNPRRINEKQFKILCESIERNPDYFETRPILVNKDMVIFAGNMRYRAAKKLELKEVPVVIMDITPERERELMIRDNVSNGEWNNEILANEWNQEELASWGVLPEWKEQAEPKEKKLTTCPSCGYEF